MIFHNARAITDVVRGPVAEGWTSTADQGAALSPYLRAGISRFRAYVVGELTHPPGPFEPTLTEVDLTTSVPAA